MAITHRTIFREMFSPFLINLFFLTFIFLMTKILDITNMIVNYRVGMGAVLLMLIYSMPFFLEFVIPMSVMMGVLLTFLRMSSDNEIIALKASGVSLYRLVPPVIAFGVIGALLTGVMAVYGLPRGRLAFKSLALDIAASHVDIGIREKAFNDSFRGVMLYVNRVDPATRMLSDVFIEDQRDGRGGSTVVVAPRGILARRVGDSGHYLRLFNGTINRVDLANRSAHSIRFDTYDLHLDVQRAIASARSGPKDEEEMSISELRQYLASVRKKDDQYYVTLMELHKKFSLPFSCIALALLAMPLGIQARFARKSFGVGLGIFFFLFYYLLLSAGWAFGENGAYPPLIGMWLPNLVTLVAGGVLLYRSANEKPVPLEFVYRLLNPFRMLQRRFHREEYRL